MTINSSFFRQNLFLAFLHFANAVPSIYFMLGLPLVLAIEDYPPSTIGLF